MTSLFLVSGIRQSHDCQNGRDLTEYELELQLSRAKSSKDENIITPFYVHPLLANHLGKSDLHPDSLKYYNSLNYTVYGDRNCPEEIKPGTQELMDISLCPWFIELDYDQQRYPRILLRAKCRCKHCVNIGKYKSDTEETICKSVTVKKKVLRRKLSAHGRPVCKDGKAVYVSAWEDIPIACACALHVAEKHRS